MTMWQANVPDTDNKGDFIQATTGFTLRSILIQAVPGRQTSQAELTEPESCPIWGRIHSPFWPSSRFLLSNYCWPICPSHLCAKAEVLGTGTLISLHWYICRVCSTLEINFLATPASVMLQHRRVKGHCYFHYMNVVHHRITVYPNMSYLTYFKPEKLSD